MKPRFNTAENFRLPFPDEEVTESPQITNPSLYSFRTNQRCNQGNAYRQGIQVDELSFSFDDLGIPREKVRDFIENLFKGSPRIGTKISPSSFSRMSERIRIVDNGFSILTFDESNGNNLPVILGEIFHQIALLLSYNISLSAAEFQKENREDVLRRYFGNEGFRSILRLSKNKERYDLSPTLCGICSEKFKEYFSDDFFTVKEVPKLSFWSIPDSRFEESIINNVIEEINFYLLGLSNLSTQDLEAISQYFDEHQEEILNYMRNTMGLIMSFINGGNHYSRILGESSIIVNSIPATRNIHPEIFDKPLKYDVSRKSSFEIDKLNNFLKGHFEKRVKLKDKVFEIQDPRVMINLQLVCRPDLIFFSGDWHNVFASIVDHKLSSRRPDNEDIILTSFFYRLVVGVCIQQETFIPQDGHIMLSDINLLSKELMNIVINRTEFLINPVNGTPERVLEDLSEEKYYELIRLLFEVGELNIVLPKKITD